LRKQVLATDNDPHAVRTARANARFNRAGALVEIVQAEGLTGKRLHERAPFDLVLANILLAPLKVLAAPMARLIGPNGQVVLSGLLAAQANAALAAYRAHGLVLERRFGLDGWATLLLRRSRATPVAGRRRPQ
jgi:ribosomal protein L11 methyltransferase